MKQRISFKLYPVVEGVYSHYIIVASAGREPCDMLIAANLDRDEWVACIRGGSGWSPFIWEGASEGWLGLDPGTLLPGSMPERPSQWPYLIAYLTIPGVYSEVRAGLERKYPSIFTGYPCTPD